MGQMVMKLNLSCLQTIFRSHNFQTTISFPVAKKCRLLPKRVDTGLNIGLHHFEQVRIWVAGFIVGKNLFHRRLNALNQVC